jgi:Meiotically Up-regulated Gene 113 (MUG113) protein
MPRELPKYVEAQTTRHGRVVHYFRRSREEPRVRLRTTPGTADFLAEYHLAMAGKLPGPQSFVYFARSGNRVKIGISKDPRARLGSLRTGSSTKIRIYYVTPGDIEIERELHRQFAADRLNGEWFIYSEQIKSWIEQDEARRRGTARTAPAVAP